ncbi:hypothetical protein KGF56_001110 [Candida oxycetoniae]|uniref:Uncharacterized protein n=1 Tax=Candida oxycetoniae TaxID=497107 RepID=A0AAI9WYZ9_9ASCO|nr:uncharacterized protein KGF56_001110 [Candida oxycetoniae]KAI3405891.2 hypothetical protein KGF56_001110 [Candida oxycetoniae]
MTEVTVTASGRNDVDDFLSSLSQLSQEKLKEDRQRQRNLQRDIDELRSRSNSSSPTKQEYQVTNTRVMSPYNMNVPDLKFNRSLPRKADNGAGDGNNTKDSTSVFRRQAVDNDGEDKSDTRPRLPGRRDQSSDQSGDRSEVPVLPRRWDQPGDRSEVPALPRRWDQPGDRSEVPALPKRWDQPGDRNEVPALPRRWDQRGDRNEVPALPRRWDQRGDRNEVPALPTRRVHDEDSPKLPRRLSKPSFGLMQPVARKEQSPSPTRSNQNDKKQKGNLSSVEGNSFRRMEYMIKAGEREEGNSTKEMAQPGLVVGEKVKEKPVKPDWLTSLASAKSTVSTPQSVKTTGPIFSPVRPKPTSWLDSAVSKSPESKPKPVLYPVIKPNKPAHLSNKIENAKLKKGKNDDEEVKPEFLDALSKLNKPNSLLNKCGKPQPTTRSQPVLKLQESPLEFQKKVNLMTKSKPPAVPAKPKLATNLKVKEFEEKDASEVRSKLQKMSPGKLEKTLNTPQKINYEEKDASEVRSKLQKMSPGKLEKTLNTPQKINYEEKDASEVRSKLQKMSPGKLEKTLNTPQKINYEEKDASEVRSKLQKMSPVKLEKTLSTSQKTNFEEQDSQMLRDQLKKLAQKKALAPRLKQLKKSRTEDLQSGAKIEETSFINGKSENQEGSKSNKRSSDESNVELSFEHKLGAILSKASTFPQTGSITRKTSSITTQQSRGDGKLEHLTKTRAKGAKRRLPKNLQKQVVNSKTTTTTTTPKRKPVDEEEESANVLSKIKKPPQIKEKPKQINVKPRVISGDLFI